MSLLLAMIPVLIIAALVALVVVAIRHRRSGVGASAVSRGGGAQEVRRLFQYAILYALVVIAASGLSGLLGAAGRTTPGRDVELATSIALSVVGAPLALGLAEWTRRAHARDAREGLSPMYALHVVLGALTGLIGALVGLTQTAAMLLERGPLTAAPPATLLVWGAVWVLYWRAAARTLPATAQTLHLLLGTLAGLVTAMLGMATTVAAAIDALLQGPATIGSVPLGSPLGALLAGALAWTWYWVRHAAYLERGPLWFILVLPIGVGGGLLTALIGASVAVWELLTLLVGDTFGASAAEILSSTPGGVGAALSGATVWWYHRATLAGAEQGRTEVRRVYEYLVAVIGLAAVAAGVVIVIAALVEALTPGVDIGISVRNTLLGAATMMLVGTPVWWFHWSRCQRAVRADPAGELASPSRRIHLVAVFGISAVAAVVALVVVAVQLAQGLVGGTAGATLGTTVRSMRFGLGVLAATAAVAAYHWTVLRHDRAQLAERHPALSAPRRVLLVGVAETDAVRAALVRAGARVEAWDAVGVTLAAPGELSDRLGELEGREVLVTAEGGGYRVVELGPLR